MAYDPNPVTIDVDVRAAGFCGFIKDDEAHCKNVAGFGTDHVGHGCCKYHGGNGGRPKTHGIYAILTSAHLRELMDAADELIEDPLDLTPELKIMRALTLDWINRYVVLIEALTDWAENGAEEGDKPPKLPDIADATKLLDRIASLADRIDKREQRGSISMVTFNAAIDAYATEAALAIREIVDDSDVRAKLGAAIERRTRKVLRELLSGRNGLGSVRRQTA